MKDFYKQQLDAKSSEMSKKATKIFNDLIGEDIVSIDVSTIQADCYIDNEFIGRIGRKGFGVNEPIEADLHYNGIRLGFNVKEEDVKLYNKIIKVFEIIKDKKEYLEVEIGKCICENYSLYEEINQKVREEKQLEEQNKKEEKQISRKDAVKELRKILKETNNNLKMVVREGWLGTYITITLDNGKYSRYKLVRVFKDTIYVDYHTCYSHLEEIETLAKTLGEELKYKYEYLVNAIVGNCKNRELNK